MPYPQLIGITGRARHGKDTIASHLVERHGYTRLAFADPLRDMLAALGIPHDYFNRDKEKPIPEFNGACYRSLAQTLGTEWGRQLHGVDFWINVLRGRMNRLFADKPHARIVISDVRFNNEARYLCSIGGTLWHVERPGLATAVGDHASEHGVDDRLIDVRLINRGITELREAVNLTLQREHKVSLAAQARPDPCKLMDRLGDEAQQFFPGKDMISSGISVLDAIRFAHYLLMNKHTPPAPWDTQTR